MNIYFIKICNVLFITMLYLSGINAQQAFTASGGDAAGPGGSVSYSLGQLVYKTYFTESFSVAEGVQQPYEISVLTGIPEITSGQLNCQVFPNPTNGKITLKTEAFNDKDLTYKLLTNNGIQINHQKISDMDTSIDLRDLPPGTYILGVYEKDVMVAHFKIILSY